MLFLGSDRGLENRTLRPNSGQMASLITLIILMKHTTNTPVIRKATRKNLSNGPISGPLFDTVTVTNASLSVVAYSCAAVCMIY